MANRFANVLAELTVAPEQRVLIALPDSAEYVGALFGTFKLGAVAVMANPALKPDEIAYFLEYTRARVAVVDTEHIGAWAKAASGSRWLKRLLVVGDYAGAHTSWSEAAARASERFENLPTHRDDGCLWLFSGGTTGQPKAVVQTPSFLRQHHRALRQGHPRLPRERRDAFGAQALLRLRHGLEPLLSVLGGRNLGALSRASHARCPVRPDPPPPADDPDQRAHRGEPDGRAPGGRRSRTCPASASPPRPGKRCPPSSTGAGRRPSGSRCSTAWAPPRCGTSSSPIGRAR